VAGHLHHRVTTAYGLRLAGIFKKKEVSSVGSKVRLLQVLIILSAFVGVLAVQSTHRRHGVLAKVS
jgi:hypothetical protein